MPERSGWPKKPTSLRYRRPVTPSWGYLSSLAGRPHWGPLPYQRPASSKSSFRDLLSLATRCCKRDITDSLELTCGCLCDPDVPSPEGKHLSVGQRLELSKWDVRD